ncbi:MAG: VWA domain-containing protein [Erysipelotrichaceae bacterium]|nr:VWA domain-containing protein [Erysipelotrichaceae bacterium]
MKRLLKTLIPCLVACFMVIGLCHTSSFTSAEESSNTPVPAHEKSISGDEENGYTLTLNVKGQKETIPGQKPKVDVVLVVDQSGSMDEKDMKDPDNERNNITRMAALKKIVTGKNGLSQTILGNENLDAQIAVVAYSGSEDTFGDLQPPSFNEDTAYNDAVTISNWVGNYSGSSFIGESAVSSINTSVNGIVGDGGTNCEAGLIKASEVFSTSRSDAQKYLIFLSDGTPTYYYANGEDYYETSNQGWNFTEEPVPENTRNPNDENIKPEDIGKREHIIYRQWVGWSSIFEWDTGWHYIEEEGVWKYGKYSYGWTTTKEKYDKGITLGDGSSDTTASEIPVPEGEGNNGICSKRANEAVGTYLNGYGLDGFYTVGVAGNANETFLKGLLTYSNAGIKAYYKGTNTASLKNAFTEISNSIMDRSLTVSNVTITDPLSDYVNLSSSVVDGTVTGATILITDANGIDVTSTENAQAGMSVSFSGNNVICDFNDGYSLKENYTYSVSFGVTPSQKAYTEFSKNNGSYGVDESENALTGFESNGLATLTYTYGDSESSETKTVPYEQKPEIQVSANKLSVTKEVKGAYANINDEFKFTLTLKDEEGNPVNDTLGGIKFVDGKYEFTLKDNEKVEFNNLPRNYSYKVEEDSYDGYETTYLTGTESDSNKPSSAAPSDTFTYGNKDGVSVTVTNTAEAVPLTGITDNTPKGLGLIGSIVVEIAAIAFVLKKKRQLKM